MEYDWNFLSKIYNDANKHNGNTYGSTLGYTGDSNIHNYGKSTPNMPSVFNENNSSNNVQSKSYADDFNRFGKYLGDKFKSLGDVEWFDNSVKFMDGFGKLAGGVGAAYNAYVANEALDQSRNAFNKQYALTKDQYNNQLKRYNLEMARADRQEAAMRGDYIGDNLNAYSKAHPDSSTYITSGIK